MKKKSPVTLKHIFLEYDDGTILRVPEDKKLRVGTEFMKAVGTEGIEWEVVTEKKDGRNIFQKMIDAFLSV